MARFRWNDQEWRSFAMICPPGHLTVTISQMSANPVTSRRLAHDRRTAEQQHIRLNRGHQSQRAGGGHPQAFAAAQLYFSTVQICGGFSKGDDHRRFIRCTGFETGAAVVKPQKMSLHTVILKQTALGCLGAQAAHECGSA